MNEDQVDEQWPDGKFMWRLSYICQECGHSTERVVYFKKESTPPGFFIGPDKKPMNCPKCKSELSMT